MKTSFVPRNRSFNGLMRASLTCLIAFMFILQAKAGKHEYNIRVEKPSLAAGQTHFLQDPTYPEEAANPSEWVAIRENQVRLVYHRDQRSDVEGNKWTYTVIYTISFTGQNLASVTDTLTIGHGTADHRYAALRVYQPGAHTIDVHIDAIQTTGTYIPDDIRLELATTTERYREIDIHSPPSIHFDATTQVLNWGFVPGAERYDVEWAWTDALSTSTADPFERAVRINVSGHYFRPDLSFREGTVHFRVRAVGRFLSVPGDYTIPRNGDWSTTETWAIGSGDRFEPDVNMQYTTTFAEDGKFKKVMTYVDGTGKVRQSLTHLNSDSTTVVTQTEYDHEGRGSLTTIPIPVKAVNPSTGLWTGLHYIDLLNRGGASTAYTKADFDLDHSNPAAAMHTASGAANYFSSSNSFSTLMRDYIPDAEGFPFSQVAYMRDATGRVARQGGVGPDHQLGSGHETRFFYGNASETELHRMFGGNVGVSSHYLKKMTVDPNGQVAFAWQDQEERVIATALAGDAPANVIALDDAVAGSPVTENLQDRTFPGQGNLINTLDHTVLNEDLGKVYTFDWDLTGAIDRILCDVCFGCTYSFEAWVTGPDGDSVTLSPSATNIIRRTTKPTPPMCPAFFHTDQLTFSFTASEIGNYRVQKTLRVLPPDPDSLMADITANRGSCPDYPDYNSILAGQLALIDSTDCAVEPCTTYVPFFDGPKRGNITGEDTIPCNPAYTLTLGDITSTQCEGIYLAMVADVSPGGWLHDTAVWAVIGQDTALIRRYLTDPTYSLNGGQVHREACHYTNCKADAPSRLHDIHLAASPTYGFAMAHHFLPPGTNVLSDLWDPWFIAPSPGQAQAQAMIDTLYGINGADYLGSGVGLLDYFGPASPETAILSTYAARCPSGPGQAACEDTLRIQLTAGAYIALKNAMVLAAREPACHYYNDLHTIVHRPALPAMATADPATYQSGLIAASCNNACTASVMTWMAALDSLCPALASNPTDRAQLEAELFDFCLTGCPNGNPLALLTDAQISNDLYGIHDAAQVLDNLGCTGALDSIAVPDPYDWNNTTSGPCTLFDPGFIALIDAINSNWALPGNDSILIQQGSVLAHAFPYADYVVIVQNGGAVLYYPSGTGTGRCDGIRLYDAAGQLVDMSQVKRLRLPAYSSSFPFTPSPFFTLPPFQQLRVEAVLNAGSINDTVVDAWVFSDCSPGFTTTQGTCDVPGILYDSLGLDPALYPEDPVQACLDQLAAQATLQAQALYQAALDSLLQAALDQASALCRRRPPLHETFTMTHTPKVYQYTLYYYDQAGSLVQTVPPEGVELLSPATARRWDDGTASRATDMPLHRMATRYAFNSLGQPRSAETPDGGLKRMWYDSKDRLRLSQDARQLLGDDYAFIQYDPLGRVTASGQVEACSCTVAQALLDDMAFPDRALKTLTDISSTVYDLPFDPLFEAANLRTRVSAAVREDAEGDTVTVQLYAYDDHGNVRKYRTVLEGLGAFDLEYRYDLISGKVNEALYQRGRADFFAHRYTYDADNRLTHARTSGDGVFWDLDGRYFYYPHGPLARLEIGQDHVQGQDHFYSVHGWIKGMNMPEGRTSNALADPGLDGEQTTSGNIDRHAARDAAAFHLGFYQGDYQAIGTVSMGSADSAWTALTPDILALPGQAQGLYNGNIAMMVTDLKVVPATTGFIKGAVANAYQYDQLQRIKEMNAWHRSANAWTQTTTGGGHGYWDSRYAYDRNGNLQSLERRRPDLSVSPAQSELYDVFTYHYPLSGGKKQHNRLDYVDDARGAVLPPTGPDLWDQDPGNYQYDAIGQIVSDSREQIAQITWDLQNKVRSVQRTSGSPFPGMDFWYDATGNRVHKRVNAPGGGEPAHEWYVRDPQGNELAVYAQYTEDDTLYTLLKEHPIYGAERLGLDLRGALIRKECTGCGPDGELPDEEARYAPLVIAELLYDSPLTPDEARPGEEVHTGEYAVLVNTSGRPLDLAGYRLRVGADSVGLAGTLAPGARTVVANHTDAAAFAALVGLPAGLVDAVQLNGGLVLPDRGGVVQVERASAPPTGAAAVDAMPFGAFFGLAAPNAYLADSTVDSVAMRGSLKSVQRLSYGGAMAMGAVSTDEAAAGDADPTIEPAPKDKPTGGRFTLQRGRKAYEVKNHLGNVLAVVSDLKIGTGVTNVQPTLVAHYLPDVLELTDYEPFGMHLANRHFVSGDAYRFGFNGKEKDDEWQGEGNMLNYGFRVHDPRIGRFLSVDPLAPDYPWYTPYQYAGNTPIWAIDIDGLEEYRVNSVVYTRILAASLMLARTDQEVKLILAVFNYYHGGKKMPNPKPFTNLPSDYLRDKYGEHVVEFVCDNGRPLIIYGTILAEDQRYTGDYSRTQLAVLYDESVSVKKNQKRNSILWGVPMTHRDDNGRLWSSDGEKPAGTYQPLDVTWIFRLVGLFKPGPKMDAIEKVAIDAKRGGELIDKINKVWDATETDPIPEKKEEPTPDTLFHWSDGKASGTSHGTQGVEAARDRHPGLQVERYEIEKQ